MCQVVSQVGAMSSPFSLRLAELPPSCCSGLEVITLLTWSWWPGQQVSGSADASFNKLEDWYPLLEANGCLAVGVELLVLLPPTGHGGEGWKG